MTNNLNSFVYIICLAGCGKEFHHSFTLSLTAWAWFGLWSKIRSQLARPSKRISSSRLSYKQRMSSGCRRPAKTDCIQLEHLTVPDLLGIFPFHIQIYPSRRCHDVATRCFASGRWNEKLSLSRLDKAISTSVWRVQLLSRVCVYWTASLPLKSHSGKPIGPH